MSADSDFESIKRGYAAFNAGDFQTALSLFTEDCEWVDAPELPGATTWQGHEGLLACWASWTGVWGQVAMEPTAYTDAGDGVYVVAQTMCATGAGSETPIEMMLWSVCTFENAGLRRVTFHLTEEAARAAAGLG